MDVLLSIDLGTSSLKAVLVTTEGEIVGTVTKSYPIYTPQDGWVEQRTDDWVFALKEGVKELIDPKCSVKGIGITGQMHGLVAIGENGSPLGNAVIWSDKRCEKEVEELERNFPIEKWVGLTGSRPNTSFTLAKILWMKKNQSNQYAGTKYFLLPKDFIRYWLTGTIVTDETDASATLMYDIRKKQWSDEILKKFDIHSESLPTVLSSVEQTGELMKEAATELDLHPGIPIFSGAGDAEAQAIGNGIVREGNWLCTIGTSGQIFTPISEVKVDLQGRVHTLCHAVPDSWHLMGATLSAGMSLQWVTQNIFKMKDDRAFETVMSEAEQASPGASGLFFLPYLFGERTPYMDPKARGAFVGLTYTHTRAEMARAVIEGVLFSLAHCLEIMESIGTNCPERITITGGAAEHHIWRQIASNVFGIPVSRCSSRGGSAYGAAILTAVGIGWFPTVQSVVDAWIRTKDTVEPDLSLHSIYQEYLDVYKDLYSHLYEPYQKISCLVNKCSY
jgi:xylulokinase